MGRASESDIRMMIATQVAYLDATPGAEVGDVIERTISNFAGRPNLSKQEQAQLETAQYVKSQIEANNLHDCNQWVVREVSDSNQENGFYGCLIDTRDGDAILGFRGSESFDANQFLADWGAADLGLLNNEDTTLQQDMARKFTEYVNDYYGSEYNSFSFTGHSLGGNLAEHATVTAPDNMPIYRCVSLDGPGYSDEYINRYRSQIADRSQYIDHYQYSVVGVLLNPLPGTNYRTIRAHNDRETDSELFGYFARHHTRNIEFDGYGNVRDGERDALSMWVGPISKGIENGPPADLWSVAPLFAFLWAVASTGIDKLAEMFDMARQMVTSISSAVQGIRSAVRNWFRSMFGVRLTGEFEVSVSYVNAVGDGLDEAGRKLQRISGEVESIAAALRYNSIAGSYYRSKLRSISQSLKNGQKKAVNLAGAVRNCGQYASSSDAKASELFRMV